MQQQQQDAGDHQQDAITSVRFGRSWKKKTAAAKVNTSSIWPRRARRRLSAALTAALWNHVAVGLLIVALAACELWDVRHQPSPRAA